MLVSLKIGNFESAPKNFRGALFGYSGKVSIFAMLKHFTRSNL